MQNQPFDRILTTLQYIHESVKGKLMVSEQSATNLREDIIGPEETIEDCLEKMKGWDSGATRDVVESRRVREAVEEEH